MGIDHPEDILPTRSLLGKRSPLVLVGAASTAAVLFAGLMSFRSGNFNLSQKMMRYRVLAQGATVGVMVATSGVAFALIDGWFTSAFACTSPRTTVSWPPAAA